MRRLILMRHAKSDWSSGADGDHERPLNGRGKAAATAMGNWLRSNSYLPEQCLVSTARRTQETCTRLALSNDCAMRATRDLYLAEAGEMLNVLHSFGQGRTVLMLGHNGGISDFAQMLVEDAPDHADFVRYPTGATTVVDFEVDCWGDVRWHMGRIVDFVVPRDVME